MSLRRQGPLTALQWRDLQAAYQAWADGAIGTEGLRTRVEAIIREVIDDAAVPVTEARDRALRACQTVAGQAYEKTSRGWECRFCNVTSPIVTTLPHEKHCAIHALQLVMRDRKVNPSA